MKIGLQLQQQRIRHNMSQNDLAEKLNISRQSISKWENGGSLPSFNNVVAISDLFDISLDELIRGDDELMDKFKDDGKIRLNHVETIIFGGIGLGIVLLILLGLFKMPSDIVKAWILVIALAGKLGVLMNLEWKYVNRSLTKKAVFWGVIVMAMTVTDSLLSMWIGFTAGL